MKSSLSSLRKKKLKKDEYGDFAQPDSPLSKARHCGFSLSGCWVSGRVALEIHFLDTGVYDHAFRFIICFEHKTTSLFTSSREISSLNNLFLFLNWHLNTMNLLSLPLTSPLPSLPGTKSWGHLWQLCLLKSLYLIHQQVLPNCLWNPYPLHLDCYHPYPAPHHLTPGLQEQTLSWPYWFLPTSRPPTHYRQPNLL